MHLKHPYHCFPLFLKFHKPYVIRSETGIHLLQCWRPPKNCPHVCAEHCWSTLRATVISSGRHHLHEHQRLHTVPSPWQPPKVPFPSSQRVSLSSIRRGHDHMWTNRVNPVCRKEYAEQPEGCCTSGICLSRNETSVKSCEVPCDDDKPLSLSIHGSRSGKRRLVWSKQCRSWCQHWFLGFYVLLGYFKHWGMLFQTHSCSNIYFQVVVKCFWVKSWFGLIAMFSEVIPFGFKWLIREDMSWSKCLKSYMLLVNGTSKETQMSFLSVLGHREVLYFVNEP